jgi:hypothetical protein
MLPGLLTWENLHSRVLNHIMKCRMDCFPSDIFAECFLLMRVVQMIPLTVLLANMVGDHVAVCMTWQSTTSCAME